MTEIDQNSTVDDRVFAKFEQELKQRLKYAAKFGDEFDIDGAAADLMKLYSQHKTYYEHKGIKENIEAQKKHSLAVYGYMHKLFGADVANKFADFMLKN